MKRIIIPLLIVLPSLALGIFGGWWANSEGFDFLCSKASVYELGKDIVGDGIYIKAGKQVNLRICEYANRFTLELYSEKGNDPELFVPFNRSPNIGNHGAEQYSVEVKE